jgi:hypothetical protein
VLVGQHRVADGVDGGRPHRRAAAGPSSCSCWWWGGGQGLLRHQLSRSMFCFNSLFVPCPSAKHSGWYAFGNS